MQLLYDTKYALFEVAQCCCNLSLFQFAIHFGYTRVPYAHIMQHNHVAQPTEYWSILLFL